MAGCARIVGLHIRVSGWLAEGQRLILANHVSWMDIPALVAVTGTVFVAHDGLAASPALRWLCAMNGTIFVARDARIKVPSQIAALRAALARAGTVTIFPEGTTSDGTALLPFKSALLAALNPSGATRVQPVWLDYGRHTSSIAWVGDEPGWVNFTRILGRAEPVELTVHFLPHLIAAALTDRKAVVTAARQAIAGAMAATALQNQADCD